MDFQNLLGLFRACASCGNSLGSLDWLCIYCENKLLTQMKLKTRWMGSDLRHQYLFHWENEDEFLSGLLKSLKGRGLQRSYNHLSLIFCSFHNLIKPDCLYYPSKGLKDHAYQWAHGFSQILEIPAFPLILQDNRKQALLAKKQRRERLILPQKVFGKAPCFVDDIVTTGSTALAAYKALNQPENFTVWSLFYRSLL